MKITGTGLVISLVATAIFAVAGMRSAAEHRAAVDAINRGEIPETARPSQAQEAATRTAREAVERAAAELRERRQKR